MITFLFRYSHHMDYDYDYGICYRRTFREWRWLLNKMVTCETHEIKILTTLDGNDVIYQCKECGENFRKFHFKVRFENNDTIITPKTKEERIP
jgi:hypothetical protein